MRSLVLFPASVSIVKAYDNLARSLRVYVFGSYFNVVLGMQPSTTLLPITPKRRHPEPNGLDFQHLRERLTLTRFRRLYAPKAAGRVK